MTSNTDTPGTYTHADLVRKALSKHPRTRAEIISLTDLTRTELSKAIYQLKKQGEIVEEGDYLVHIDTRHHEEAAQESTESTQTDGVLPSQQDEGEDAAQAKSGAWTMGVASGPSFQEARAMLADAVGFDPRTMGRMPEAGPEMIRHPLDAALFELARECGTLKTDYENALRENRELKAHLDTIRERILAVLP